MRTRLAVVAAIAASLAAVAALADEGRVYDELTLESKILGGPRKFAVYLPPDYERSQRRYPVLYLLHGGGDDQTGWVQFGEVLSIADKAILAGEATPMIIVMPDANSGRRGYFNSIDGEWRYEDFFFAEFIPSVEGAYRIKGEKRYRAVAGLSMGGGGSYMYALHRPDMFSSACPLSASAGPLNVEQLRERLSRDNIDVPEDQLEPYLRRHSAIHLIEAMPEEQKSAVRWYIDCGDDDQLFEGNSLAHIAMRKRNIPHEFRIHDGGHNWTYWRRALPHVLAFVSEAFHQH